MAVMNGFVVPSQLLWRPHMLSNHFRMIIKIEGIFIDICFILDIIVSFFTSYLDIHTGREIVDGYKIMIHYGMSSRFIIDFISIFGSDVFTS